MDIAERVAGEGGAVTVTRQERFGASHDPRAPFPENLSLRVPRLCMGVAEGQRFDLACPGLVPCAVYLRQVLYLIEHVSQGSTATNRRF